ncbi:MAG: Ig-like domain-containing protein, partial [Pseudomonadales bacterium]|nr:Ig-like domain-containing protein [Pseudomonadales bacterium]
VNLAGITAGGGETQPLRVTATSSNTDLIANPAVAYTSAETTGSLSFTPLADQHGTSTITVMVEDGGLDKDLATSEDNATTNRTFDVTVGLMNDNPTLNQPADLTLGEDAPEQTVDLTGITAGGGEIQPLRVTATSSNTDLIANPAVAYTSAETTGSLSFTPLADQYGTSTITVTVEDGGLDDDLATSEDNATITRSFEVTVHPVNDEPTLTIVSDDKESIFEYASVSDSHASEFIVSSTGVRTYSEWQSPPVRYYGPTQNNVPGELIYRFDHGHPVTSAALKASIGAYNLTDFGGGSGKGEVTLSASGDGADWVELMATPIPDQQGIERTYDDGLPENVIGGPHIWIKVVFHVYGAPNSNYTVAQF